ncbi:MAG: hypothetical protein V4517_03760 [Pseudomonadota bacterium]
MDKVQAAEIQRHMLDAAAAISPAEPIICTLDEMDREALAAPFTKLIMALHFELLHTIYTRYPDLRPPAPDRNEVDTTLRWEDVVLQDPDFEANLDSIIFSVLSSRLQKTAVVLSRALEGCKSLGLSVDLEAIGARIEALADADRLEAAGDVRKWHHSEVRLNAETSPEN